MAIMSLCYTFNMTKTELPIKIAVVGARNTAEFGSVESMEQARFLGKKIAESKCVLNTPATFGFPLWVADGAKRAGGFVVGFSPAANEREHLDVYKLSIDHVDLLVPTGFGFGGSDLIMSRSSDAVIVGFGGVETIHEFAVAFLENRPIGILKGDWRTDDILKEILEHDIDRDHENIVIDDDPTRLVDQIVKKAKQFRSNSATICSDIRTS